ncbi:hypothetical protein ABZW18_34015 [Streptomyces sp. NPDC004647]|uniref:hypothetical protein n=1 Tax=Streptomyces sp. NPDC004647 TaxID=3154671 RepID=UPI0033ADA2FB
MNDDLASQAADPSLPSGVGETAADSQGCLFALSQPPLMLFLAVIAALLLFTALYDLYPW